MCQLTDSSVAHDGGWSHTALSPRDTVRLGNCIANGTRRRAEVDRVAAQRDAPGARRRRLRHPQGAPGRQQKQIAIKNGWIDRTREQEMHVNCLAIGDTWTWA